MGHGGHGKDGKVRKNTERIRVVRETCTEPVEVSVSKDFDNSLSRIDVKVDLLLRGDRLAFASDRLNIFIPVPIDSIMDLVCQAIAFRTVVSMSAYGGSSRMTISMNL